MIRIFLGGLCSFTRATLERVLVLKKLTKVKALHEHDLEEGYGEVYLPFAQAKQRQNACREWCWLYVLLAAMRAFDPCNVEEKIRGHHEDHSVVNKAIKRAVGLAGIN